MSTSCHGARKMFGRVAYPRARSVGYGHDNPPRRDPGHAKRTTEQKNDGDSFAAGVGISGIKRLAAVVGTGRDWRPSGPGTHSICLNLKELQMTSRLSLSVPEPTRGAKRDSPKKLTNRDHPDVNPLIIPDVTAPAVLR